MTVRELIDASPFVDTVEVVVRKEGCGQWIQGYRVGKDVHLFPVEITKEVLEKNHLEKVRAVAPLEEGQEVDCEHGSRLPMKVIRKSVKNIPDHIGNLKVCAVIPRRIPKLHDHPLDHGSKHEYDISCYPDGYDGEQNTWNDWR